MNNLNQKIRPLIFRLARIVNKAPAVDENLSLCISRCVFNIDCVSIVITLLEIILTKIQFHMDLPVLCFSYVLTLPGLYGIVFDYHNNGYPTKQFIKWSKKYIPCKKEHIRNIVEIVVLAIIMVLPIIMGIIYYKQVAN